MPVALRTARLLLREWRDEDAAAFAALPAGPEAMPFLPPPDPDWVSRVRAHWREHGFGQFVVELPGEAPFIGVVGLAHVRFQVPFTPAVEAAWRLAPAYWAGATPPRRRVPRSRTALAGSVLARSSLLR